MKKQNKKVLTFVPLESAALGRLLFFTCLFTYVFLYFGRSNFSAVLPSLILHVDPETNLVTGFFTESQAGLISSAFFIVYGAGQFINGLIAEKFPPFGLIGTSFALGTAANFAMYLATLSPAPNLYVLILVWAINGYAQSFVFTSFMRIFAMILPETQRNSASTNIFIGAALGPVLALLLSQQILRVSDNWQLLFLAGSIAIGVSTVFWFISTRKIAKLSYKYVEVSETDDEKATDKTSEKRPSMGLFALLITSGVLVITIPAFIFAFVKDGLQTWAPEYIVKIFGVENSFAVGVSTIIPLFGIGASFLGRFAYEKLFNCEIKTTAFLFIGAAISLICAAAFMMNSLWGMLILIAIAFTFLAAENTMIIGLIPIRFARHGRTATITGIFNSIASVGLGLSSYFIGLLAENLPWENEIYIWSTVFYVLAALSIIAFIISLAVVRRWTNFKKL